MNNTRLKKLVHYILTRCDEEELSDKLGAVKLNKILWFIDITYFRMNQKSLSGVDEYVKQPMGPVPRNIQQVLEELEQHGDIKVKSKEFYGYTKKHFTVLNSFDDKNFSDDEKQLINDMVKEICNEHTADSISNLSHTVIWEDAQMGGRIPVYACLAENVEEITPEILEEAKKVVKKHHKEWSSNIEKAMSKHAS